MCTTLIHVYNTDTCVQHWYMCTTLIHVYNTDTCVQHWYMCTTLIHVYNTDTCVQHWYMCTTLIHVYNTDTSVPPPDKNIFNIFEFLLLSCSLHTGFISSLSHGKRPHWHNASLLPGEDQPYNSYRSNSANTWDEAKVNRVRRAGRDYRTILCQGQRYLVIESENGYQDFKDNLKLINNWLNISEKPFSVLSSWIATDWFTSGTRGWRRRSWTWCF